MPLDLGKYLALFVSEAGDHLAKMGGELVQLEATARAGGDTRGLVDGLFRHAHSVKGMAASMQQEGITALAHRAEDLLALLRRQEARPETDGVDLLLATVDGLNGMVQGAARGENPEPDGALLERLKAEADRVRSQTPNAEEGAAAQADGGVADAASDSMVHAVNAESSRGAESEERLSVAASGATSHPAPGQTFPARRPVVVTVDVTATCPVPSVRGFLVLKKLTRLGGVLKSSPSVQDLKGGRIPGRRLEVSIETAVPLAEVERALAQISDLASVAVREELPSAAPVVQPIAASASEHVSDARTVRVRVELLDSFLDAVGELILATARLREIGREVPEPFRPALEEGVDRLHVTVKDIHDKVMAVRMTPLALVTERLPRAARDLARRIGKQIEVEIRGAEIEIDRAILDELGEGLLHVLRNAVDHGIEAPHLRLLAGKTATGHVTVSARRDRDRVLVEIADDGKGMDARALRAAAVAKGALSEEAASALSDREAFLLACLPGVSTAETVTELSGRGVGMDAVKRMVEELGGALEVESTLGLGTRWLLRLPLTVAVQPVLLVNVGLEVVGLPIAKVHGAAEVEVARLDHAQGMPVLPYQGRVVPVRDLGRLLGFPAMPPRASQSVVVADGDGALVGLAVDALLGQQEAVLKPLSRPLDLVQGLSAVTVLGNGRPVFILDVQQLVAA